MPGQETGALVRKIHAPKTGLPRAQEGLADGVIVGPNEAIVDGDVFKLRGVPVRAKDARIVPRCDHQIGVHRALGLVQRVHERTLFLRAELHHVSSHWRIIALEKTNKQTNKHISSTGHALIGNQFLKPEMCVIGTFLAAFVCTYQQELFGHSWARSIRVYSGRSYDH